MMAARSTPATTLTPTATDESAGAAAELADRIRGAVAAVTDPEYPDLTIADLGILERVTVLAPAPGEAGPSVLVELVPTVLGCPALRTIELDVVAAALAAGGVAVEVRFLHEPVWSPERITGPARDRLARDYTITLRGRDGSLRCPLCGSAAVTERSAIGPTRCRAVYYCADCRNPVEVIRR